MSSLFEGAEIVKEVEGGLCLLLWVHTKARKTGFGALGARGLEVYVREVPEKGRANRELVRLLKKSFRIPKDEVKILKGEKSRQKLVFLKGVTKKDFEEKFVRQKSGG